MVRNQSNMRLTTKGRDTIGTEKEEKQTHHIKHLIHRRATVGRQIPITLGSENERGLTS